MAFIPQRIFFMDTDRDGYCYIWDYELENIKKKYLEHEARMEKLNECVEKNNIGIALEKQGKIDEAIGIYEENIFGNPYPATHSFDRLMILYRKQKRFKDEIRVIKKAIHAFPNIDKYKERLQKAEVLLRREQDSRN
jgi:tetratricopeptide (TPR) repeat protein